MSGGYFHPCSHKLTLVMIVILSKFLNLMDLKFSEKSGHKILFVWKPQTRPSLNISSIVVS